MKTFCDLLIFLILCFHWCWKKCELSVQFPYVVIKIISWLFMRVLLKFPSVNIVYTFLLILSLVFLFIFQCWAVRCIKILDGCNLLEGFNQQNIFHVYFDWKSLLVSLCEHLLDILFIIPLYQNFCSGVSPVNSLSLGNFAT